MLEWELSDSLRGHNWRQTGLFPNRNLGSHDLSEQMAPTVLAFSTVQPDGDVLFVHDLSLFSSLEFI